MLTVRDFVTTNDSYDFLATGHPPLYLVFWSVECFWGKSCHLGHDLYLAAIGILADSAAKPSKRKQSKPQDTLDFKSHTFS
jgi:hypothetical protein